MCVQILILLTHKHINTSTQLNMLRLLIADDHSMFADGIESILATESDIEVVGKCPDGNSVFNFLKEKTVDLILLDVNLPDMSGIEVSKKLNREYPEIKILAVSMFNEESFVTEILQHGASGYILKNTGKTELLKAIQTVNNGQSYFSKEVTQTIMGSLMKNKNEPKKKTKLKISRREKEVLQLIMQEFTTQEIANKLFVSIKTIESHRGSLLSKLNARNTAGLVRIAMEEEILK
ncbi:MAG: DNA-binding NarL/FixJ family response regulator [Paraglaciecola sp.]